MEMNVITRKVIIEDEEFILVEITNDKIHCYGTINYKDTYVENGNIKLSKRMCLGDMAISECDIQSAITERVKKIKIDKFLKENNINLSNENDVIKFTNFMETL